MSNAISDTPEIRPAWGLPTAAPEVVLYYKADGQIRDHDAQDFRVLAPLLDAAQRSWLRQALSGTHPWQAHLAG